MNTKVCPECGKLMIKEWGAQLSSDPPQQAWVWWCGCGYRKWGGVEMYPNHQLQMIGQWEEVNHPLSMSVHMTLIQRRARDLFGWDLPDHLAEYIVRLTAVGSTPVDDYIIALAAAGPEGRAQMRSMEDLVAWYDAYKGTCGMQQGRMYVAKRELEYAVWQELPNAWKEGLETLVVWVCGAWDWLVNALDPHLLLTWALVILIVLLLHGVAWLVR